MKDVREQWLETVRDFIGLWDRFNLREEVLEQEASRREGRTFDWDQVGTSDRVVLRNFVIAGEEYLDAVTDDP